MMEAMPRVRRNFEDILSPRKFIMDCGGVNKGGLTEFFQIFKKFKNLNFQYSKNFEFLKMNLQSSRVSIPLKSGKISKG
jgi:hypothetical protein